ncbi:hypothetical protein EDD85DRAFT_849449 [Armillaria nabsnona]|nr:hypothetical protein EDD85DRAFT_849449 [Armillaria nabsnona]
MGRWAHFDGWNLHHASAGIITILFRAAAAYSVRFGYNKEVRSCMSTFVFRIRYCKDIVLGMGPPESRLYLVKEISFSCESCGVT